jgi:hypothetical protein
LSNTALQHQPPALIDAAGRIILFDNDSLNQNIFLQNFLKLHAEQLSLLAQQIKPIEQQEQKPDTSSLVVKKRRRRRPKYEQQEQFSTSQNDFKPKNNNKKTIRNYNLKTLTKNPT